jgi:hypothetical protein
MSPNLVVLHQCICLICLEIICDGDYKLYVIVDYSELTTLMCNVL